MQQWQQALQAEQSMDAGRKRVALSSAFQITEIKGGGIMVNTTAQFTQMHDIVKTLQDGPESVEEIFWSEGPWLGEELEKAWEKYNEVQGYSPLAKCGNDECRSKDLSGCVLTCAALPSTSPSSHLHAPFTPSTPVRRCQAWIHHAHHCTRCEVVSPQVEAMQARHRPVCLKRLLSRTDESQSPPVNNAGSLRTSGIIRAR